MKTRRLYTLVVTSCYKCPNYKIKVKDKPSWNHFATHKQICKVTKRTICGASIPDSCPLVINGLM